MASPSVSQAVFWILAGILTAGSVILLVRPAGLAPGRSTGCIVVAVTGIVPLATLALYLMLGRPELALWRTRQQLPPFVAASVAKLTQDAHDNPTDIQAWILLGDVYAKIGRYGEAEDAYRRAAALDPKTALYKAMVGQMLVTEQGGAVEAEALAWFAQSANEPTSRYYEALARSQAGDWKGALVDWQRLEADAPSDILPSLRARIAEARIALGLDGHLR